MVGGLEVLTKRVSRPFHPGSTPMTRVPVTALPSREERRPKRWLKRSPLRQSCSKGPSSAGRSAKLPGSAAVSGYDPDPVLGPFLVDVDIKRGPVFASPALDGLDAAARLRVYAETISGAWGSCW